VPKLVGNISAYFRRIAQFAITTSLFLGLNFALVVYFSAVFYEIVVPVRILLLAILTTIAVYSLNKVTDQIEDDINKPDTTSKHQQYFIILAVVCYIITLVISFIEGPIVLLVSLITLFIGAIYSVKIFKTLPKLKALGMKNITVAFTWAFTGSLLPALVGTATIEKILLVFLYIFTQIFVNTVLFDTLDIRGDKAINAKTIPLWLGKKKTAYLLLIVNSLLFLWLGACFTSGLFINYLPAAAFGIFYNYGIIWYFTKKENKRFNAEVFVDGEWIFITALLWLIIH
jgi:4-hydroxybenzoate polyprenyltransferase